MAPAAANRSDYTVASSVPATSQRPIPTDLDQHIKNPGVPRATRAVSKENPEGKSQPHDDTRTVLQRHVDFWDTDHDGIIYPLDTYRGFHAIGFNFFLSFLAMLIIHSGFAYWSQDSWIPSPTFAIHTKNIHRTRHGSDSQIYDAQGRFNAQYFETLFTKYDKDNKGGLSLREILDMMADNRKIMDPFGWSAAAFEWGSTFYVLKNSKGYVEKEDIRGMYDGSVFYRLQAKYAKKPFNKEA